MIGEILGGDAKEKCDAYIAYLDGKIAEVSELQNIVPEKESLHYINGANDRGFNKTGGAGSTTESCMELCYIDLVTSPLITFPETKADAEAVLATNPQNVIIGGRYQHVLRVCDSTWSYDTINPGKTEIVDIVLSSVLEPEYWDIYGIQEVGNVALKVSFKDGDNKEFSETALLSIDIPGTDASFSIDGTEVYNGNGIRIISKGVYADPSGYSDDLHVLLVAENTSGKTLILHDVYDSLSINDYILCWGWHHTLPGQDCHTRNFPKHS